MLTREFLLSEISKRNLHLKRETLQEIQFKKTKKLLKLAFETVPIYHKKFKNAKLHPDDIRSLEDYPKVPTVTKAEIQSSPTSDLLCQEAAENRLLWRSTSGSTGVPLNVAVTFKS